MKRFRTIGILALGLLLTGHSLSAQVLYLDSPEREEDREAVFGIGDTVEIEVRADLGRFSASGISFFVSVPRGPFEVIDLDEEGLDIQPFSTGHLFDGSLEAGNSLAAGDRVPDLSDDQQMLSYAAIIGPGARRGRTGSGVVARFALRCVEPVYHARIAIESTPIHETRLVLEDGFTERLFTAVQGLELTVARLTAVEGETWGQIKADSLR